MTAWSIGNADSCTCSGERCDRIFPSPYSVCRRQNVCALMGLMKRSLATVQSVLRYGDAACDDAIALRSVMTETDGFCLLSVTTLGSYFARLSWAASLGLRRRPQFATASQVSVVHPVDTDTRLALAGRCRSWQGTLDNDYIPQQPTVVDESKANASQAPSPTLTKLWLLDPDHVGPQAPEFSPPRS